ncbi:2-dehydropantoate 2-reductase [Oricola indica]|uniref:2-dehydropantoate 2-reductase n=1 Tax=Oricola indica TaxID=2872591 RepID=UPI003CCBBE78
MKIGIMGSGSVGCHVGGALAAAGHMPVLVGRAAMGDRLADGILITRYDGTEHFAANGSFVFSQDVSALADCDVILVCVKSIATRSAAETLAPLARPDALIVSLQNGISNPAVLAECLAPRNVLAGMVGFNVAEIGTNRFHCATSGEIVIGEGGGAQALVEAFDTAGIPSAVSAEIESVQWGKLLYNLNNAVNTLSGMPLKRQLAIRPYRLVMAALIREALTVFKAAGIIPAKAGKAPPNLLAPILTLPNWLFLRVARGMLDVDENAKASMLLDLERGRQPEIDWLNGEIAALGRKTGVATPANDRIIALVKAAFSGEGQRAFAGEELKRAVLG